ncbi:hypothetical protein [Rudaeicoccus suwonensis]|uniref:hypothetical protein n=1 Tax=Rudaeicoccus suwonensis TaxID=657409 RepID=UPI00119DEC6E|nr:hypothetical protein [Rudaeicoccus suwonensis]
MPSIHRTRRTDLTVFAIFSATFAYLLARCFIGVDFNDGSYVIALARRMAAGQAPLSSEMDGHTLGSMFAVPFTWVWISAFGITALVAASKAFAAVWIAGATYASYRALAPLFSRVPTALTMCAMCLALPYSLIVTSYNTVPMFGLLLATCAGYRTISSYSRRWTITTSLAATLAVVGFPIVGVAAVLLLIAVIWCCRHRGVSTKDLLTDVLAPCLIVAVLLAAFVLAVPGLSAVRESLHVQSASRQGAGSLSLLTGFISHELSYFTTAGKFPLALAAAIVAALMRKPLLIVLASLISGLLLFDFATNMPSPNTLAINAGLFPAPMAMLVTITWLPIAIRVAVTSPRYRGFLLLSLTALPAAAGVQMVTASGYDYGAAMDGLAPFTAAVLLGFGLHVWQPSMARAWRLSAVIPLAITGMCLTAVVFQEGPVFQHRTLVTSGPAAGLWVADNSLGAQHATQTLTAACPAHARALLVGLPGIYLWLPARSAATVSWLAMDSVRYIPLKAQLARHADCVIATPLDDFTPPLAADKNVQQQLLRGMRAATPPIVVETSAVHGPVVMQTYVRDGGS